MSKKTVVIAITNCTVAHNGEAVAIIAGDPWDADSPIVKAYPSRFVSEHDAVRGGDNGSISPVDPDAPVERATRAPGERRKAVAKKAVTAAKKAVPKKKPAKKAAAKPAAK